MATSPSLKRGNLSSLSLSMLDDGESFGASRTEQDQWIVDQSTTEGGTRSMIEGEGHSYNRGTKSSAGSEGHRAVTISGLKNAVRRSTQYSH
jgi:hypothetical protein